MTPNDGRRRLETAVEAGMNLVDTADVYGLDWGGSGFGAAEDLLGDAHPVGVLLRFGCGPGCCACGGS